MDPDQTAPVVICCTYLLTLLDYFSIEANSVDPDQTAPLGAV